MTCNDANIEGDINAKTFKSEFYYNGQKYSEMRLSAEAYEDNVGYLIMQELISILGAKLRHTIITPTSVGVYEVDTQKPEIMLKWKRRISYERNCIFGIFAGYFLRQKHQDKYSVTRHTQI